MKLVPENLNELRFERGGGERDIKTTLFGFRPGQIVTGTNRPIEASSLYIIEDVYGDSDSMTIIPFGFIFGYNSNAPAFSEVSGESNTSVDAEHIRPLNDREAELVRKFLEDPKNKGYIENSERRLKGRRGKEIKIFIG